jgi:hypothetical protein
MKITKCNHVTATERQHLKAFLQSGMTSARVNTKTYTILSGTPQGKGMRYEIRITTPQRNDYGDKVYNNQTITLIT